MAFLAEGNKVHLRISKGRVTDIPVNGQLLDQRHKRLSKQGQSLRVPTLKSEPMPARRNLTCHTAAYTAFSALLSSCSSSESLQRLALSRLSCKTSCQKANFLSRQSLFPPALSSAQRHVFPFSSADRYHLSTHCEAFYRHHLSSQGRVCASANKGQGGVVAVGAGSHSQS